VLRTSTVPTGKLAPDAPATAHAVVADTGATDVTRVREVTVAHLLPPSEVTRIWEEPRAGRPQWALAGKAGCLKSGKD
jgi:hypothetical protein